MRYPPKKQWYLRYPPKKLWYMRYVPTYAVNRTFGGLAPDTTELGP
jgi:hypothetical protein